MVVHLRGRAIRLIDLASMPVLGAYVWAGCLALLVEPPGIVEIQLGPIMGVVWACCLIAGPLLAVGSMLLADQYAGTQLRAWAGLITFGAVGTYTMCAYAAYGWASFIVVIAGGLSTAALLALAVDVRALRLIRRLSREPR